MCLPYDKVNINNNSIENSCVRSNKIDHVWYQEVHELYLH